MNNFYSDFDNEIKKVMDESWTFKELAWLIAGGMISAWIAVAGIYKTGELFVGYVERLLK